MQQVIVVGAINHDLVANIDRRPAPGETIFASSFAVYSGGKGANQAAAAARSGALVAFVGAVGDDDIGRWELSALESTGVLVGAVAVVKGVPTGQAMITVTPEGENSIIVIPGANARVDIRQVESSVKKLCSPDSIVVLQTELPSHVIDRVARLCQSRGARVVLNNGPCVRLAPETLRAADPLVVNQTEAAQMAGLTVTRESHFIAQELLRLSGAQSVVVTLGVRGSFWQDRTGAGFVPSITVSVVDTTGAGDAFIGTLAAALSRKSSLGEACSVGTQAAAVAVTWKGARPG
jgi:ribokinase